MNKVILEVIKINENNSNINKDNFDQDIPILSKCAKCLVF